MKFIFLFLCLPLGQMCFGQVGNSEFDKAIADYERPFHDSLVAADYLDLEIFGGLNRRKKKNVNMIFW